MPGGDVQLSVGKHISRAEISPHTRECLALGLVRGPKDWLVRGKPARLWRCRQGQYRAGVSTNPPLKLTHQWRRTGSTPTDLTKHAAHAPIMQIGTPYPADFSTAMHCWKACMPTRCLDLLKSHHTECPLLMLWRHPQTGMGPQQTRNLQPAKRHRGE